MKTKSIFIAVFIGMLLVFSGCSENVDIPSTPNNNLIFIQQEGELTPDYDYEYFELGETDSIPPNYEKLEDFAHFLLIIEKGIRDNYVEFNNRGQRIAYLQKIKATIKQIRVNNFHGAIDKIDEDLIPHAKEWLDDGIYKTAALSLLEVTRFTLSNSHLDIYVPHFRDIKDFGRCVLTGLLIVGAATLIIVLI